MINPRDAACRKIRAHPYYNALAFAAEAPHGYEWNTPPFDVSRDWTRPVVKRPLKTLQQVTDTSAQERHSLEIGYGDFTRLSPPDRADIQRIYAPEDYDFTPSAGSRLVDAGVRLPTINDGFAGKAPDIGAIESGATARKYGPRSPVPGTPVGDQAIRSLAGPG